MGADLVNLWAAISKGAGGQIMTSQLSSTPFSISAKRRSSPSEAVVPFIFQFPATRARGPPLAGTLIPPPIRLEDLAKHRADAKMNRASQSLAGKLGAT